MLVYHHLRNFSYVIQSKTSPCDFIGRFVRNALRAIVRKKWNRGCTKRCASPISLWHESQGYARRPRSVFVGGGGSNVPSEDLTLYGQQPVGRCPYSSVNRQN